MQLPKKNIFVLFQEKENEGQKASEATVLSFAFQTPFIEKIDPTVTTLLACE